MFDLNTKTFVRKSPCDCQPIRHKLHHILKAKLIWQHLTSGQIRLGFLLIDATNLFSRPFCPKRLSFHLFLFLAKVFFSERKKSYFEAKFAHILFPSLLLKAPFQNASFIPTTYIAPINLWQPNFYYLFDSFEAG